MRMSAVASQSGRNKVGNYVLLEKIGKGSMATVYKGQHAQSGQPVAIKVMAPSIAAERDLSLRFARECKVARALNHPHIVRVLDFGLEGSQAYLVMEYVRGQSLGKCVKRQGRLAEEEAV